VGSHIKWLENNYPRYDYEMPFPEISYAGLFLKTKEERDAYKEAVTGRPRYTKGYTKKKWQHQRD
jgi:hypothetical protein